MISPGDRVAYTGRKFSSEIGNKQGLVVARVDKNENVLVVDFGDGPGYILQVTSLRKIHPSKIVSTPTYNSRRYEDVE